MPRIIGVGHRNYIIQALTENQQEGGYRFEAEPKEVGGQSDWDAIACFVKTATFEGNFCVQQMPGCCAVLVLSYIRTHPFTQETVDQVIAIVEKAAYDAGFGSVAMTQVVPAYSKMFWKKEPWIRCLDRNWTVHDPFRNAKSGNLCVYLTVNLNQPGKRDGLEVPIYAE